MFVKMPPPLEHVLVVEKGPYQTLIMELYSQWCIDLPMRRPGPDQKKKLNLLGYVVEAVQNTIYVVITDRDQWNQQYHILYTSEEDYAMGLLAGAGN